MRGERNRVEPLRAIGIMGGTFDPIHYGHLLTAEEARWRFNLDLVIFVPSGIPPHKPAGTVSEARHRYLMTVLAVLTNPHFDVSRVDIDRRKKTYTVDTLKDLRELYPEAEFYFITGADAMQEILKWKDPDELMALSYFIAASRPGFSLSGLEEALGPLWQKYSDRIHLLEIPAMGISSTNIRERVRDGKPIRYLVPEPVEYYIIKNRLYVCEAADVQESRDR